MAAEYDLEFKAGDDESVTFRFWADSKKLVPLDLTGRTYRAEVRARFGATGDPLAVLSTQVVDNTVTVSASAALTRALRDEGRRFYWDLEETFSLKTDTLFEGAVTVTDDVTR